MNYLYHLREFMREMIYRGLYHFSVAHQKGLTSNPVTYFASP